MAVTNESNHLEQRFDLGWHAVVGPGRVVELAHRSFLFTLATVSGPAESHRPDQEVWTDFSGLEQLDEELSELLFLRFVLVPVVFALVLAGLLFVASHNDDLDLALDDHPPEIVDRVRQGTLAGDVSIAATCTLVRKFKSRVIVIISDWNTNQSALAHK